MVEYNIVKFCGLCKKRMVVGKKESRRLYCDKCQAKLKKSEDEDL